MRRPEELVEILQDFHKKYRDGQTAGGMFGLLYADHLREGSHERSPNTIARQAKLSCGPDILTGYKISRHFEEIFSDLGEQAVDDMAKTHARSVFKAVWKNRAISK